MDASSARRFNSDNYAGAHPEVLAALVQANSGHQPGYGDDPWTTRLREVVRGHFGEAAQAYPVLTGTGANVVSLAAMLPRWGSVITPASSHLNVDENAAPERMAGIKLLTVDTPDGKLTPAHLDEFTENVGDPHRAQPLAISIAQPTELGTVYRIDELRALVERAHALGMAVHIDGARLANAAAALGATLGEITTAVGADVVTLGGTKNGIIAGEVIVVLDPAAGEGIEFVRKFSAQLASKMRFVSAQLVALYGSDLWLRSAAAANAAAARLRAGLDRAIAQGLLPGVELTQASDTNAVFAVIPERVREELRARFGFYDWNPAIGEVRLMCSFDTTDGDVDEFVAAAVAGLA
ncbi:threonine aldolase family protein [Rarobacter incanus]|uniref:L-threonine aldolase n=1 Tax=Rarobacter incanus TaxID=153494 RepID=A0A542SQT2_9MICO|nr:beta-eliminating lyase-related protein [Rarobacter incanus]TQK76981.1 L-threonine aldolase [Rarobacter incanus]